MYTYEKLLCLACCRASFLKPGTSLIEIAWPTMGWHFFYADHGKSSSAVQMMTTYSCYEVIFMEGSSN